MSWSDRLARFLFIVISILAVGSLADGLLARGGVVIGADATDGSHGRSGVRLITDHGTGCEYLATTFGGITARLDATGKQTGCRRS